MTSDLTPKGERRRQAIVMAASQLLREEGLDAVRHRAVASRAGLPLASTTYYFRSLHDLVVQAVEFSGRMELERVERQITTMSYDKRDAEVMSELIVDLVIGELGDAGNHEELISRYERLVTFIRNPELHEVQRRLRVELGTHLRCLIEKSSRVIAPVHLSFLISVVEGAVLCALLEGNAQPHALVHAVLVEIIDIVAPQH
ncbi:MAG: TetR/AcrR family transcriptional regulator [Mycobacteriaceae bacterium]